MIYKSKTLKQLSSSRVRHELKASRTPFEIPYSLLRHSMEGLLMYQVIIK